jgi:hypothetical protein
MSSIEKGNELLAAVQKVVGGLADFAGAPHSQGELRTLRRDFRSSIADLQRMAQDLCTEQPSGKVYDDERAAIFSQMEELGRLVRNHLPQDPTGLVQNIPSFYPDDAPGRAEPGEVTARRFAPTLDDTRASPPIPEGWVRKPDDRAPLIELHASLKEVLQAMLGDNAPAADPEEKKFLVAMLRIALHQLDPSFDYLPKGLLPNLQERLKKHLADSAESVAKDATKSVMKKALGILGRALVMVATGTST